MEVQKAHTSAVRSERDFLPAGSPGARRQGDLSVQGSVRMGEGGGGCEGGREGDGCEGEACWELEHLDEANHETNVYGNATSMDETYNL